MSEDEAKRRDRRDLMLITMAEALELLLMHCTRMELEMANPTTASTMAMKSGELSSIRKAFSEEMKWQK